MVGVERKACLCTFNLTFCNRNHSLPGFGRVSKYDQGYNKTEGWGRENSTNLCWFR